MIHLYKAHVKTQFDNIYSQLKDEGNSIGENSATSTDEENEESDVSEDFVTYQGWVRKEGKIRKKTISQPKKSFTASY